MKSYGIYRDKLSYEDYFNQWSETKVEQLTEGLMKEIYEKYLVKCEVFQRDSFGCINLNCRAPNSSLTMHHVKWQKNGGKDSVRNCITLCDSCHKAYHRGKLDIKLANTKSLPKNMRGMTYATHKDDAINWKQVRKENKALRKTLRDQFVTANWDIVAALMRWLEL